MTGNLTLNPGLIPTVNSKMHKKGKGLAMTHKRCILINGKPYIQLDRTDVIREGALHSYDGLWPPVPLGQPDTPGKTPEEFSPVRVFFNPLNIALDR